MSPPYNAQSNLKGTPGLTGNNNHGGDGVWGEADSKNDSAAGRGVVGISNTGAGIWGDTNSGRAVVGVVRLKGDAVWGETKVGRGVVGISQGEGTGVWGDTESGRAVVGVVHNKGDAVWGEANSGNGVVGVSANGSGVVGRSNDGAGVFGRGVTDAGVIGFHGDPRLQETTVANNGAQAGVFGASDVGSGIVAYTRNSNMPAIFAVGGIRVAASTNNFAGFFDGNVQVNGDIFVPGADCAEHFDVADGKGVDAGTVVVIHRDGTVRPSERAYDKKVAGVISGAGAYRPGLVLDKQESKHKRQPVALVGKVYCKVDAQYAPVAVGDMLTTSPTPGHAMKANDPLKAFGAVIGKALDDLDSGAGLVRILVCLQ
jgi:hypothetical protein